MAPTSAEDAGVLALGDVRPVLQADPHPPAVRLVVERDLGGEKGGPSPPAPHPSSGVPRRDRLGAPAPPRCRRRAHGDGEGVAVGDLVVDDGLDVDGLQLELDGDVDEPTGGDTLVNGAGGLTTLPRPQTPPQTPPKLLPRGCPSPPPRHQASRGRLDPGEETVPPRLPVPASLCPAPATHPQPRGWAGGRRTATTGHEPARGFREGRRTPPRRPSRCLGAGARKEPLPPG